ncbi:ABC transporter permease [Meiothermus granaticius NBRC 107808]|nr:ABC transporter permease [Meiothermus granaticius NBRC 107808]
MVGPGSSNRLLAQLAHLGLWLFSLTFLLPLGWLLLRALSPEGQPFSLGGLTLDNFVRLIQGPFGLGLRNSLWVGAWVVALGLPLAALLGYALARYQLGGHTLRFGVLATQMLPPIVLALPLFAIFRALGWSGSLWGLVIAYLAFALPFMTWLLMGFFRTFPRELEEAARVDGAGSLYIFARIVLPLSIPGLFAAGVMGFLLSWNEFLFALLLSGRESQTVPVVLSTFITQRGVLFAQVAAGVVLAVLPVALLARVIDRYLVEGLTMGAVK